MTGIKRSEFFLFWHLLIRTLSSASSTKSYDLIFWNTDEMIFPLIDSTKPRVWTKILEFSTFKGRDYLCSILVGRLNDHHSDILPRPLEYYPCDKVDDFRCPILYHFAFHLECRWDQGQFVTGCWDGWACRTKIHSLNFMKLVDSNSCKLKHIWHISLKLASSLMIFI